MTAGAATRWAWRGLDALGSRAASVGLMAALLLYVVLLLGWTLTSPPAVVAAIAGGVPFEAAYLLLAVNTVACAAVFWRTVRARCQPYTLASTGSAQTDGAESVPPGRVGQPKGPLDSARGILAGLGRPFRPDGVEAPASAQRQGERRSASSLDRRVRRWFAVRGFRTRLQPDGSLHARRGRFSALGSPLFHLALVLAAAGALLEDRAGFSGTALVNEGQSFFGEPREYLGLSAAQAARAPQLSFSVKSIHPEYYGEALFFTELVAEVEGPVGPGATRHEVRLSGSTPVGEGELTLMGFGYSLEYALRRGGATVDEGLSNLLIFPPGRRDALRLPGLPYAVFVELFPDFVAGPRGEPRTRGMALGDARLGVTVLRHREVLARQLVPVGGVVHFDGYELALPRLVPQGQFRVRRSPGVAVLGVAFALMLLGLFLRLLWTRREALVGPQAGGFAVALEGEWSRGAALELGAVLEPVGRGR